MPTNRGACFLPREPEKRCTALLRVRLGGVLVTEVKKRHMRDTADRTKILLYTIIVMLGISKLLSLFASQLSVDIGQG